MGLHREHMVERMNLDVLLAGAIRNSSCGQINYKTDMVF